MVRKATVLLALIACLPATTALPQSLADIEKAEDAVVKAWMATPLVFRRAVFVSEPPQGFGLFKPRADAVFKPNEPLVVYAEPAGYAWKDNGDGSFTFGFNVDLLLKTAKGEIVGGQENFQKLELVSQARNREFMLTLTLNVDGAPPDDYVVEYRIRDANSDKSGLISLPFTLSR